MPILTLLYLFSCLALGLLGRGRKLGFAGFFVLSLVLTPFVTAVILVLGAPRKPAC